MAGIGLCSGRVCGTATTWLCWVWLWRVGWGALRQKCVWGTQSWHCRLTAIWYWRFISVWFEYGLAFLVWQGLQGPLMSTASRLIFWVVVRKYSSFSGGSLPNFSPFESFIFGVWRNLAFSSSLPLLLLSSCLNLPPFTQYLPVNLSPTSTFSHHGSAPPTSLALEFDKILHRYLADVACLLSRSRPSR